MFIILLDMIDDKIDITLVAEVNKYTTLVGIFTKNIPLVIFSETLL